MPTPLLALDVDGAVSPFAPVGTWPDFTDAPRTPLTTLVSVQMGQELAALPAQRVWLTDWQEGANNVIAAGLGWEPLPVLQRPYDVDGWWKLAALRATRLRRGRALIWVDDHLGKHPEAGAWAARLRTPTLLISPNPLEGITAEHIEQIAHFCAQLPEPLRH